jgi:hypothetical protein
MGTDKRVRDLQYSRVLALSDFAISDRAGAVEAQKVTYQQIVNLFRANAAAEPSGFISVEGNELPTLQGREAAYTIVDAGEFSQQNGSNIITYEALNVLGWDGSTWHFIRSVKGARPTSSFNTFL